MKPYSFKNPTEEHAYAFLKARNCPFCDLDLSDIHRICTPHGSLWIVDVDCREEMDTERLRDLVAWADFENINVEIEAENEGVLVYCIRIPKKDLDALFGAHD